MSGEFTEPVSLRIKPREYRRQLTNRWQREVAFQVWFMHGGVDCPLQQVAAHFGISRDTVKAWHSRDGWEAKWRAVHREKEERERNPTRFLVSSIVGKEQVARALTSLWLSMVHVIRGDGQPGGGLRANLTLRQKPAVTFRIKEFIEVTHRIEAMIEQEAAAGLVPGRLEARYIPKQDLEILASIPKERLKNIRLFAQAIMLDLRDHGFTTKGASPDVLKGKEDKEIAVSEVDVIPASSEEEETAGSEEDDEGDEDEMTEELGGVPTPATGAESARSDDDDEEDDDQEAATDRGAEPNAPEAFDPMPMAEGRIVDTVFGDVILEPNMLPRAGEDRRASLEE